jgi:hypothetical protein
VEAGQSADLPPVAMSEQSQNLLERFVLRFRHLFVCEGPENGKKHGEWQEGVIFEGRLKSQEHKDSNKFLTINFKIIQKCN